MTRKKQHRNIATSKQLPGFYITVHSPQSTVLKYITCASRLFSSTTIKTPSNTMSQYYGAPPNQGGYGVTPGQASASASNLQFYPSTYSQPVSGHATPSQASYGYAGPSSSAGYGAPGFGSAFGAASGAGAPGGVSGRMGEQGGLRTGWLAALSTEGYDGEPPLLEELGVNFSHIQAKVGFLSSPSPLPFSLP